MQSKKTTFVNEILYHYIKNEDSATHLIATPENVLGHISIPDYLTEEELKRLETEFESEYKFFQLSSRVFSMNMLSRWVKFHKGQKQEVKSFIREYVGKEICKEILRNQNFSKMIKLEIFFLKTFGVVFHLTFYPCYEFARIIVNRLKALVRNE